MVYIKYLYILLAIISIIGISTLAVYMNKKAANSPNKDPNLEVITITPHPGGVNEPVKVKLDEKEIENIPIYRK